MAPDRRIRSGTAGLQSTDVHPIERLRYVARSSGAPQDLLIVESARALASFHDDPVGLVTACRRVVSRQLTCGGLWWLCSRMLCAPDPLDEARAVVGEVEADDTARQLAGHLASHDFGSEVAMRGPRVAMLGWPVAVSDALARGGVDEVLVIDAGGEGSACVRALSGHGVEAIDVPLDGLAAAVIESDVVLIEADAASPTGALAHGGALAAAAVAHHRSIPVWLVVGSGRTLPTRVWDALIARWDQTDDPWEREFEVVPLDLVDGVIGPTGWIEVANIVSLVNCPIAPELFKADIT